MPIALLSHAASVLISSALASRNNPGRMVLLETLRLHVGREQQLAKFFLRSGRVYLVI